MTVKVSSQVDIDSCQLKDSIDAMKVKGGDLKEALTHFLTSDAFRNRIERKALPQ